MSHNLLITDSSVLSSNDSPNPAKSHPTFLRLTFPLTDSTFHQISFRIPHLQIVSTILLTTNQIMKRHLEFPLAPMGVLAPGSAPHRRERKFFGARVCSVAGGGCKIFKSLVSDRSTFSKPAGWSTISKSAAGSCRLYSGSCRLYQQQKWTTCPVKIAIFRGLGGVPKI